jgi:hypothetical protein
MRERGPAGTRHASHSHDEEVTEIMPAGPGTQGGPVEPVRESSAAREDLEQNVVEQVEEERRYDDEESDADEPRPPADS